MASDFDLRLPAVAASRGRIRAGGVQPVESNFGSILTGVVEVFTVIPESCVEN